MSRKNLVFLFLLFIACASRLSAEIIDVTLNVGIVTPTISNGTVHRTPPAPLQMMMDGNVLYLPSLQDEYEVRLEDLDGVVVWQESVCAGGEVVAVSCQLTGCYKLVLVRENISYYAYLNF